MTLNSTITALHCTLLWLSDKGHAFATMPNHEHSVGADRKGFQGQFGCVAQRALHNVKSFMLS